MLICLLLDSPLISVTSQNQFFWPLCCCVAPCRKKRRSTCSRWTTWSWGMSRRVSCPASIFLPSSTLSRGLVEQTAITYHMTGTFEREKEKEKIVTRKTSSHLSFDAIFLVFCLIIDASLHECLDLFWMCTEMCIRTTVSWSWPVRVRKT